MHLETGNDPHILWYYRHDKIITWHIDNSATFSFIFSETPVTTSWCFAANEILIHCIKQLLHQLHQNTNRLRWPPGAPGAVPKPCPLKTLNIIERWQEFGQRQVQTCNGIHRITVALARWQNHHCRRCWRLILDIGGRSASRTRVCGRAAVMRHPTNRASHSTQLNVVMAASQRW